MLFFIDTKTGLKKKKKKKKINKDYHEAIVI